MAKLSFVVLLDKVKATEEQIRKSGVALLKESSDLSLGYFTVEGSAREIQTLREFLGRKK